MDVLASLWWLWVLLAFCGYTYAMINQINRIKRVNGGDFDSFSKGLYSLALSIGTASVSTLLFIISVVWILIVKAKS